MTGLEKAIDLAGGQNKLAALIEVAPMTISHWKSRGIPAERCREIEDALRGEVTRQELRPDLFGDLVSVA